MATAALHTTADAIQPGDYLPPQAALHGTPHQHTGYRVGPDAQDVLSSPATSGQILLFNRATPALFLPETTPVLVHRPAA
jgi:hypothetical protein